MNAENSLQFVGSPGFTAWLHENKISIALTSYHSGKLFLIGLNPEGGMSVYERSFTRCMGLWATDQSLWVASLYEIWRFENVIPVAETHQGYDRCYVPRVGHVTGDLNVHDVAVDRYGRIVFVNTLFNCLAVTSQTHSFSPLWKPSFIKQLVPQDHCHLNGMAMQDGAPRFASMFSQSDERQGWRDHRLDGGCVIDLQNDASLVEGLSMPHSPRLYRDRLWLLQSGTGEFGYVDRSRQTFEPVTFCPGYARGLAFVGNYAIVGISKGRDQDRFDELPLARRLKQRGLEAICGLAIIDLTTGETAHTLSIEGLVTQLYDVAVLPGVIRPMAIGFKTDEIQRMVSVGPPLSRGLQ